MGFLSWRAGATLGCSSRAFHCDGFFCCGAWAVGWRASVVIAHGLSSCGSWALEHRADTWWRTSLVALRHVGLPGPGIEPMSPALACKFLTTEPPGKPPPFFIGLII